MTNLYRTHEIEDALSCRRNDRVNDLGQVPGHITELWGVGHAEVEARLAQRVEEVQDVDSDVERALADVVPRQHATYEKGRRTD